VSTRDPVTVVVADDHPMYRQGVIGGLSGSGQVVVVAETGDGREALEAIRDIVHRSRSSITGSQD
jgi:two-component system nitrate/nitrite response regulator NarL